MFMNIHKIFKIIGSHLFVVLSFPLHSDVSILCQELQSTLFPSGHIVFDSVDIPQFIYSLPY